MRKVRISACLLLLVLMFPAMFYLRSRLPMDAQPLIEKKYGGWAGVLRLWVCETWQTGAGSISGWLNRAIASFEKAHPGVYVQPEYVDASTLRAMGADGLLPPDLALFPPGVLASPGALLPLDGDYPLRQGLDVSENAAPVMLGGYMWAYNAALLDGIPRDWRNIEVLPALPEDTPEHKWRAALLALCSGKYAEDAPGAEIELNDGLELGLPSNDAPTPTPAPQEGTLRCRLPSGFSASGGAWRDFTNGDAAAMPVSQREVRKLQALSEQGKGVDWKLAAAGHVFTDQVYYIGIVDRAEADERRALCQAFVRHLLSEDCQSDLRRAGAFSVTDAASGYTTTDPLADMDSMLRHEAPVIPEPFDGGWFADIENVIQRFLEGDPDPAALWAAVAGRMRAAE